jgi:hypothetical protein
MKKTKGFRRSNRKPFLFLPRTMPVLCLFSELRDFLLRREDVGARYDRVAVEHR